MAYVTTRAVENAGRLKEGKIEETAYYLTQPINTGS